MEGARHMRRGVFSSWAMPPIKMGAGRARQDGRKRGTLDAHTARVYMVDVVEMA